MNFTSETFLNILVVLLILSFIKHFWFNPPRSATFDHSITFPVRDSRERIARSVAAYVWEKHKEQGIEVEPLGLVELSGGFDVATLDKFYPLWRSEGDLVLKQQLLLEQQEQKIVELKRRIVVEGFGRY